MNTCHAMIYHLLQLRTNTIYSYLRAIACTPVYEYIRIWSYNATTSFVLGHLQRKFTRMFSVVTGISPEHFKPELFELCDSLSHARCLARASHFAQTSSLRCNHLLRTRQPLFLCLVVSNKNFHKCCAYLHALALTNSGKSSNHFFSCAVVYQTSCVRRSLRHFVQTSKVQ